MQAPLLYLNQNGMDMSLPHLYVFERSQTQRALVLYSSYRKCPEWTWDGSCLGWGSMEYLGSVCLEDNCVGEALGATK